tara:strand:- start:108 stop:305 length:198 start_codon:yes stop_codon:yes gene_type:complete
LITKNQKIKNQKKQKTKKQKTKKTKNKNKKQNKKKQTKSFLFYFSPKYSKIMKLPYGHGSKTIGA